MRRMRLPEEMLLWACVEVIRNCNHGPHLVKQTRGPVCGFSAATASLAERPSAERGHAGPFTVLSKAKVPLVRRKQQ